MHDPKSTSEIRAIAVDAIRGQAETCAARRENLVQQMDTTSTAVAANARAITDLTVAMAKQTTSFTSSIDVLKVRLTISAAIGGCLPVLVVLAWQYITK